MGGQFDNLQAGYKRGGSWSRRLVYNSRLRWNLVEICQRQPAHGDQNRQRAQDGKRRAVDIEELAGFFAGKVDLRGDGLRQYDICFDLIHVNLIMPCVWIEVDMYYEGFLCLL